MSRLQVHCSKSCHVLRSEVWFIWDEIICLFQRENKWQRIFQVVSWQRDTNCRNDLWLFSEPWHGHPQWQRNIRAQLGKDCTVSKSSGSRQGSGAGIQEIWYYLEENARNRGCRCPSHFLHCWEQLPSDGECWETGTRKFSHPLPSSSLNRKFNLSLCPIRDHWWS